MKRQKFETRRIILSGAMQVNTALALVPHLPVDPVRPLELIVREQQKQRKPDQNALMWVGPLKDMEEQAYIDGRNYSAEVWHEYFKKEFLPEEFDEELTKEGYVKWDIGPDGERVLVGSTTQLTVKGMSIYLEQIYAFGSALGVQFHANPKERLQR